MTLLTCKHEEFEYPAPTSENSPLLPDSGTFDAGLLSTAGVPVNVSAAKAYRFRRPKIPRSVQSVCFILWSRRRITWNVDDGCAPQYIKKARGALAALTRRSWSTFRWKLSCALACSAPVGAEHNKDWQPLYHLTKHPPRRSPSLRVGIKSCLPFISYVRRLCRVVQVQS